MLPLTIINQAIESIFPYYCLVCRRHIRYSKLCHSCLPVIRKSLNANRCTYCFAPVLYNPSDGCCLACRCLPRAISQTRFLYEYTGSAQALISVMKYRPSLHLAKFCGDLMAQNLFNLFDTPDWDLIIPIPSSRTSLISRGFNQCAIFAKAILKRIQLRNQHTQLSCNMLIHRNNNKPQASLSNEKRLKNVASCFVVKAKPNLAGSSVLLVDDVATTGATSNAAAHLLLEAGAATIDLFTLARSDTWYESRYAVYRKLCV